MFSNQKITDDFKTPLEAWIKLSPYIPCNKKIWSPFYCDGSQKQFFNILGFDIIHEDEDFFENDKGEIVVCNPPFSKKREVLERLVKLNKPFMVLLPSSVINNKWFHKLVNYDFQIIFFKKEIHYKNLNEKVKYTFNWGTYCVCWKIGLDKDINFI